MAPRRLVFLVTEDWYFIGHRLPMARAARDAGYEVHVATRIDKHGEAIAREGFYLHPVNLYRGSVNPLNALRAVAQVRALYRRIGPALAHHVATQPVIIGALAALGMTIAQVGSIFGFGAVFASDTVKARLARLALRLLLPRLLNRQRSCVLVENPGDREALIGLGVDAARITVFPGSGVDVDRFAPLAEPGEPVTFGYAGRMLEYKGVRTLAAAQQRLAEKGYAVRLVLAGTPDPANPNSVARDDIEAWAERPGVNWLGQVDDVRAVWAKAHVAVLVSRSEGLPVSLLEAAACGRPIIASDIPGCREIARAGETALLVPADDVTALADAMKRLADDKELRRRLGAAARKLVEDNFSSAHVGRAIVAVYDNLIADEPAR
jgi:glycosyltransferase involved in cell wall biosynthesis